MYACLDLGGNNIRGTWIDANASRGVLMSFTRPATLEGTKEALLTILRNIEQEAPCKLSGIGLATAGPLDYRNKRYLATTNTPELDYFRMGEFLESKFSLPVLMENDAQAAALGEVWQGALAGFSNAVVITLGTGLGSGVIINNHIWRGEHITGPELGHIFLGDNDVLCGCGQYGCAETWLNKAALMELFREQGLVFDQLREVVSLLENGDLRAKETIHIYGRRLGLFLSVLQVMFGIKNICIGGGLSRFVFYSREDIWQQLEQRLQKRPEWLPESILCSQDPDTSALYGMARRWSMLPH